MRRLPVSVLLASVLVGLLLLAPPTLRAEEEPAAVDGAALVRHVAWLAAPERKGRGAWPEREACAAYIARHFADAGLQPLPGHTTMFQDKAGLKAPALRNVVAWLPPPEGATPEHVILSAHYDHLGQQVVEVKDGETVRRTTTTFHGADDNATGVAALLEIARVLGARHRQDPSALRRGVVFVAFDLEERGCLGSRHYVEEPLLPLEQCAAFVTMDMLGRSIGDLAPGHLFAMGTESSAVVEAQVRAAGQPAGGRMVRVGIDFQPGYSDYVPFAEAKVPYLFVTSGACRAYHQPGDVPAGVQADPLRARTVWCLQVGVRLARTDARPRWREGIEPRVEEVEDIRALIRTVEANLDAMPGLPPMARTVIGNYGAYLDKLLADGAISAAERGQARLGALNLFRMAQQMAAVVGGPR